jgi:hypothetical protein
LQNGVSATGPGSAVAGHVVHMTKIHYLLIILVSAGCLALSGLIFPASAGTDVVILKNGQVFENVTILSDGDTLHFEDGKRAYFIGRDAVDAVIRTGHKEPETIAMPEWAEKHLAPLPEAIQAFAGRHLTLILIAASVILFFLCIILLKMLWVNIRPLHDARREKRRIFLGVRQLDPAEKAVLREFAIFDQNTLELPVEDPVVSGLIQKGLLQPTREKGEYSIKGLVLPVTINPLARKRITPAAVDLPQDWQHNPEQKKALIMGRPPFIREKEQFIKALEAKRPGE